MVFSCSLSERNAALVQKCAQIVFCYTVTTRIVDAMDDLPVPTDDENSRTITDKRHPSFETKVYCN